MTARRTPATICGALVVLGVSRSCIALADVVVVDTPPGQAYANAGIEAGDVLVAWRLDDADGGFVVEGRFDSVFDVYAVSIEQAPRGPITVSFERKSERTDTVMPPARTWVGDLRPAWSDEIEREASRLLAALKSNPIDTVAGEQVRALGATIRPIDAAWLLHQAARAIRDGGEVTIADELSNVALDLADRSGHPLAAVSMTRDNAIQFFQSGNAESGLALFEESRERAQAVNPDSLVTALALNNLAIAHANRSEFDAARERAGAALAIRERLAPESLPVAESLHTLGNVAFWTDHLDDAAALYARALTIRERHVAGGLPVARNLQVLANVEWRRGRLDHADALMQRAADLYVANSANDGYLAEMHVTLGHLASDRGHYREAEQRYLRGLDLFESFAPGTRNYADTLHALGVVALSRGDDEVARIYEERALAIYEPLEGEGQRVALVLTNLGRIALRLDDTDEAEEFFRRSLEIVRNFADDGFLVATRIADLGDVARARGQDSTAERYYREALEMLAKTAPDSLSVSAILTKLGVVSATVNMSSAVDHLKSALAIAERLGPGTLYEARPAYELAMLNRDTDRDAALAYFGQAIDALEDQRRLIGGPDDVNARFAAQFEGFYKDYIQYLADLDMVDSAADTLDRYRAQNLRVLLADRNLDTPQLPAELRSERVRLNREYGLAYKSYRSHRASMSRGDPGDALARLRSIRIEQRELTGKAAGLSAARPLDADLTGGAVDIPDDALLLSFAVMPNETLVFARTGRRTTLHRAPIARPDLAELVRRFRLLVRAPNAGDAARATLDELGLNLGSELIAPAIAGRSYETRLIVMPDHVLRLLPFAALRISVEAGDEGRYLAESFAVNVADSVADLQMQERAGHTYEHSAIAFGSTRASPVHELSFSPAARGLRAAALPFARREVQSVSELFGPDAIGLLDEDATETRAKQVAGMAPIFHFATHGLLDDSSPLDSFLLLSAAGDESENGLLQAWEIIEQLNVDGAMVVLSACETALGEYAAGEGILGLTRAFRLAGAENVLASLWTVKDASTAELMARYYARLKSGTGPAESLRQAQLDFLRQPIEIDTAASGFRQALRRRIFGSPTADYSHPYYWAPFQSYGRAW